MSWRGFYVQSNNAVLFDGTSAIQPFLDAFDNYWNNETAALFGPLNSAANWIPLGLNGIDAKVTFSPHAQDNVRLKDIADDICKNTTSTLFYSLAYLYQTPGAMQDTVKEVSQKDEIFVYGVSDKKIGGLELQKPDTNISPVFVAGLDDSVPEPFKSEPAGGGGIRMHHKFVVIDFDQPTARLLGLIQFLRCGQRQKSATYP